MKRLHFEDYEELASDIADKFDSLTNEYGDVAVVAKYDEAKAIVRELVCLGYSIEDAEFHRPSWDNYYDEYIILLNFDGIWCSPMKYNGEYTTDESEITYILDNCSSNVIPYCMSNIMYEVGVGNEEDYEAHGEFGCNYIVNGKAVSKEEFDNYISKFKGTDNKSSNFN